MAKNVTGTADGKGGVNKVVPLGKGQQSNNAWLGIDSRVEDGTTGSRPESSARYGGERDNGTLFKGASTATDSKQLNSGGNEKASAGSGQYGAGASGFASGGVGAREQMTLGGEKNVGKLVGDGANATPLSTFDRFFNGLPVEPGLDLEHGTSDFVPNMKRSQKGLGSKSKQQ